MFRVVLVAVIGILAVFLLNSAGIDSGSSSGVLDKNKNIKNQEEEISQGEKDESTPDSLDEAILEEIDNTKVDIRNLREELERIESLAGSKYKGLVRISSSSGARQSTPTKERIELKISSNAEEKIKISNWRLESAVTGKGVKIGRGTYLPYSAQVNNELDIFVEAGDKIIISTGRSPIGASFRLNTCTGYFEQFQNFDPSIRKICPKPIDELPNLGPGDEFEKCFEFVRRLPRCEVYLREVPIGLGGSCWNFISEDLNYNNCVQNHKEEEDFYLDEWRIYLGRNNELWKSKRELIKLIDNEGKVVDAVTY
jgi:hypothetical protein